MSSEFIPRTKKGSPPPRPESAIEYWSEEKRHLPVTRGQLAHWLNRHYHEHHKGAGILGAIRAFFAKRRVRKLVAQQQAAELAALAAHKPQTGPKLPPQARRARFDAMGKPIVETAE